MDYEIRLESIGGLGANLCGKMLGEMGVKYLDLNSVSFSSYGSEKTGTPVKGYIRYCDKNREIRAHSPIVNPNLLTIFHQALLNNENTLAGCGEKTDVLLAVQEEEWETFFLSKVKNVYLVPAQQIAMETHARMNMVMLGAMIKVMGFAALSDGEKICTDVLGKKYPYALSENLEGLKRGYEEVKRADGKEKEKRNVGKKREQKEKGTQESHIKGKQKEAPKYGYATATAGGIITQFGNTVISDLSPSRQGFIPLFIKERCINCGLCDTTCPDMVFQFAEGTYNGKEMMVNRGLDYYHCKGCLRCVEICPVNALVKGKESEHPKKEFFLPNQDLLRQPDYYEKAGADGYITSESFLTEKRMDGGEV